MAKVLRCGDVLPGTCPVVIAGNHVAEIMMKFAQHVKQTHGMTTIPAKLAVRVKWAIRDT